MNLELYLESSVKSGTQKINKNMKTTLDDILIINLRSFEDNKGSLIPIESELDCLIDIKRIFYVYNVPSGETRGKHSHKKTIQVLICIKGSCEVKCDDGVNSKTFVLSDPSQALYVPEGIWAEETYETSDTLLMVLCNTRYEKEDYIFDYEEFKHNKK